MKRAVFVMMLALAAFSVSCGPLCSFHPLLDKEHVAAEPKLIETEPGVGYRLGGLV